MAYINRQPEPNTHPEVDQTLAQIPWAEVARDWYTFGYFSTRGGSRKLEHFVNDANEAGLGYVASIARLAFNTGREHRQRDNKSPLPF